MLDFIGSQLKNPCLVDKNPFFSMDPTGGTPIVLWLCMSNVFLSRNGTLECEHREIVTVTAKQYLAVAENVLQALFPGLPLSTFADGGERNSFAVYIKDDDDALVEARTHSC